LEQIIKQRVIKDWQMEKAIKKRLGMHASFHAKQKGKQKKVIPGGMRISASPWFSCRLVRIKLLEDRMGGMM
jgi:hypothetical protein